MSSGSGRIYQRGKTWWIDYHFRGKRFRESSGSTRRKDATKLLRKRMGEMGRGKLIGPDEEKMTFDDLAQIVEDDYRVNSRKSLKRLQTSLKHLRGFFGFHRALDITTDRVRAYTRYRQDEGAANASIQKELAALKRALNLAAQAGRLTTVPHVPSVRVRNVREGFFEPGELKAVIEELPEDLRPVARFAALTGWRKAEILGLRWGAIDWDAGVVRLAPGTTKNDEGREFPFRALPELEALLEDQLERTRTVEKKNGEVVPWVFHRDGRQIKSLRGAWDAACKRAGMAGAWFHDLRRTAVRNLEKADVPRSVAMKLTGHKTESVYRRYAIADRKAMEEGVEKLARMHNGGREGRKVVPLREAAEG
jgi:integrase